MPKAKDPPQDKPAYQSVGGGLDIQVVEGVRLAGSQRRFNVWAATRGKWSHRISLVVGALLLAAILMFEGVLAFKIAHDGPLLWWGASHSATVISVERTDRNARGGRLSKMLVTYAYDLPDGPRHTSSAVLTDLKTAPDWKPGDRVDIKYNPNDPKVSTLAFHLADDVYRRMALAVFLLFVPGGLMIAMFWRYWRRAHEQAFTAHTQV